MREEGKGWGGRRVRGKEKGRGRWGIRVGETIGVRRGKGGEKKRKGRGWRGELTGGTGKRRGVHVTFKPTKKR